MALLGFLPTRGRRWLAGLRPAALWLATTVLLPAAPAPAEFTVREWHVDDGLPAEGVFQIHQDRRGRLWISTAEGLVRFDGSVFGAPPPAARAWSPEHAVQFFAETADGGLLLVPRSGELLELRDDAAVACPLPAPWHGRQVVAFLQEPGGARWFALRGGDVVRIDARGVRAFGAADGVSPKDITRFALDARGRVWLASDTLLGRYDAGRLIPVDLGLPPSELRIASARAGGPWVVTADRVLRLDADDRAVEFARVPPLLGAHFVAAACEDATGALWLGTRSQGMHRVTAGRTQHVPTSSDDIRAVFADAEGTLWVGTNSAGLNAIGPRFHRLLDKTSGLKSSGCFALCVDDDGAAWFANGDGGLTREHDGALLHLETRLRGAAFGAIAVAPARGGGVWLAGSPGLFRVRPDQPEPLEHIAAVPAAGVRRTLFTARNGDLWLSVDPDRVGRWREPDFATFGHAEGFAGREPRVFAEDAAGALWVGTADGGLFRFDEGRFVRVPLGVERPVGDVYAIHFGPDGRVWLGTGRAGLLVLGAAETIALTAASGLPDDTITHLVADDAGRLWCGSERGVFRLEREELQRFLRREIPWLNPLRLGRDDGLARVACSGNYGPGAAKDRDGRVWLATRQGVLCIDPARIRSPDRAPVVEIEEIRCDDRPVAPTRPFAPGAYTRKLEFRFSVLCLSAPSRVQARYRLDGFDSDWVLAGAGRVATYPRLPPGRYCFRVSTGFGGNAADGQTELVPFVVPPPWWLQPWVLAAALVVGVAGVTLAVRAWSHRRLRRATEALERRNALERERTRIARNIHDDVGASLTHISLLTQAISPTNPPKPETLEQIFRTTREIARALDETVWAVNPRYDTLESFAGYVADFAQRFLNAAGVRCRLDLPDRLPEAPFGSHVRHQLFLCCREALNNVVRHAGATEVTLRLAVDAEHLELVVADDGRGFAAATPAADRVTGGTGLENLRRRMTVLGGTCTVESRPGGGTTVALRVGLRAEPPRFDSP